MSTKSFIISLPIITGDQDRRRLRKSFSFGCNLQNAVMGGGWDRVLIHGHTWSAPFLQGLGVAFRVQLPPEGAQTQTRALIQFRGEATF
ncbi:MAG: hypothetical protein ACLS3M_13140 [Collinsella sp.]